MRVPATDQRDLVIVDPRDEDAMVPLLRKAWQQTGFFYCRHDLIANEVIESLRARQREFFAAANSVKQSVAIDQNNRGYLGTGQATMHGATQADEKEVFFWGADHGANDPDRLAGVPLCGPNQWPAELPGLRQAVEAYSTAIERLGNQLLRAIARSLDAPPTAFEPHYTRSMTRGQLIRYPTTSPSDAQFGVAPHTDFGCITLLLQETSGLEARIADTWVAVPPIPGTLVINVGDLLERWSGGRLPSTVHRVVNRSPDARYSIAMFHDPNPTARIDPRCLDAKLAEDVQAVTAAEYILSRNRGAFAHFGKADTATRDSELG